MHRQDHGMSPNRGSGRLQAPKDPADVVSVTLSGRLRWIERDGTLAVLEVQDGTGRARRFERQHTTLDLRDAQVTVDDRDGDGERTGRDLLPGDRVSVRVSVARRAVRLPDLLSVRRVGVAVGVG